MRINVLVLEELLHLSSDFEALLESTYAALVLMELDMQLCAGLLELGIMLGRLVKSAAQIYQLLLHLHHLSTVGCSAAVLHLGL